MIVSDAPVKLGIYSSILLNRNNCLSSHGGVYFIIFIKTQKILVYPIYSLVIWHRDDTFRNYRCLQTPEYHATYSFQPRIVLNLSYATLLSLFSVESAIISLFSPSHGLSDNLQTLLLFLSLLLFLPTCKHFPSYPFPPLASSGCIIAVLLSVKAQLFTHTFTSNSKMLFIYTLSLKLRRPTILTVSYQWFLKLVLLSFTQPW